MVLGRFQGVAHFDIRDFYQLGQDGIEAGRVALAKRDRAFHLEVPERRLIACLVPVVNLLYRQVARLRLFRLEFEVRSQCEDLLNPFVAFDLSLGQFLVHAADVDVPDHRVGLYPRDGRSRYRYVTRGQLDFLRAAAPQDKRRKKTRCVMIFPPNEEKVKFIQVD